MSVYKRGRPHKYNAITGDGSEPPRVVGEYRIKTKIHTIKYIGITNDLYRRMNEHIRSGKINENAPYFEWMAAKTNSPYQKVRDHEERKIKRYNPELNRNKGRGGREPRNIRYRGLKFGGTNPTLDYCVEIDDGKGKTIYGIDGTRKRSAAFFFALYRILWLLLKCVVLATVLYFIYACYINKLSFQEAVANAISALHVLRLPFLSVAALSLYTAV